MTLGCLVRSGDGDSDLGQDLVGRVLGGARQRSGGSRGEGSGEDEAAVAPVARAALAGLMVDSM